MSVRLAFTPFAVILRREGGGHTGGHNGGHTFCENPNKSQIGLFSTRQAAARHRAGVVDTPRKVVDTPADVFA